MNDAGTPGRTYRILEVVGRGGFGTVYRAEMIGTGGFTKQVAIKVLNAENNVPEEILHRLRDEARILGLLRHRAIVGVDSLAVFDDGWAVVMEYVPGVDLATVLQDGPVPPRVALEIVEEVAAALHAAYAVAPDGQLEPLRLVHRDIKPSNIRVTSQGEVKVLDFGVARANFDAREAHTSAYMYGSLKYMAIERLEGIEGPAADIYALGLVMAELILGRDLAEPPRQAERYAAYVEELLQDLLATLHGDPFQTGEGPTAGVVELVRETLSDDAEKRPTAYKLEHSCRSLRQGMGGPWLRDWAAGEVPRLVVEATVVERSPSSGSVLVERSAGWSADDDSGIDEAADEPRGSLIGRPILYGALGLVVVFLGGASVVGYLGADRIWGEPQIQPEPVVHQVPVAPAPPPPEPDPVPEEPQPDPVELVEPTPPRPAPLQPPPPDPVEVALADPEPPAVPQARVNVTGDARTVWLVSDQGRYPAGAVPPGRYEIKAWFESPEPAMAGAITLHDGESVTLRCVSAMARCARAQ